MSSVFVHESSYVDAGAEIGEGTAVWHFCHIMAGARVGRHCVLGQNVFVASDVTIGDGVKIQNNVSLYTGVILENNVFVGPSAVFTNVINPRSHIRRRNEFLTTLVKRGASIGANSTVLCGVTLGEYSFVGAGAVVTRDVPNHALVYGSPAKVMGWVCECNVKLSFRGSDAEDHTVCSRCGVEYVRNSGGLQQAKGVPAENRSEGPER